MFTHAIFSVVIPNHPSHDGFEYPSRHNHHSLALSCLQLEFAMVAMGFHSNQPENGTKKGSGGSGGKARTKGRTGQNKSAEEAAFETIAGDGAVTIASYFALQ